MARAKRKKKFWDVEIPTIKGVTQLYAFTPEELNNRVIKYDLTRMLRGKNAVLQLRVKVVEGKPTSLVRELRILPSFLRKMIRKNTNYVEDSFSAQCKDGVLRIKPFLITRRKVSRAVRKALRNKAKEELVEYSKEVAAETFFKDVIKNQLQKQLSLKLKKIYPLSLCEIRVLKVEKMTESPKDEKKSRKKTTEKEEEPQMEEEVTEEVNEDSEEDLDEEEEEE